MATPLTHTVDLTWDDLRYTVKAKNDDGKIVDKELLHGVSGTARGGRLLAVMGPSGAGKSTFLNGVCGRLQVGKNHVLSGTAYLNNVIFLSRYKSLVSYVAQDDIVMGKDTPREALTFSYRMRSGASSEESKAAVDAMIDKLSLNKCADTLLGIPGLIKGVSGGEKKRTNIGAELVNDPFILFLDEPTTGLDSVNALRVGQLLRDLANQDRRTVICTIHSPSSELYDVFDDLMLLAKGSVVYHGSRKEAPDYFAKVGYGVPQRINPSEHFMKLLQLPSDELNGLIKAWAEHAKSPESDSNRCINRTPNAKDVEKSDEHFDRMVSKRVVTLPVELMLLTQRAIRITYRDPAGTFGRLIQCLFFAVLLALFFANLKKDDNGVTDRAGVLFMATINITFLNVLSALATFPPERAVFLQEQTNSMYSAALYYISKCIAEFPIVIAIPFLYTIITYWSWDLAPGAVAFFNFLVMLEAIAYTANAFGLFTASLFPRPEIAMTITPLLLMPQMLVGGLFANTERLEPYWVWLNYISFPRYGYKGLFTNEFDHVGNLDCPNGNCRFTNGKDVEAFYGFDKETDKTWFSVIILIVIMLLFRVIGALGLHIQGAMRRSELVFEGNYKKQGKGAKGDSSVNMNSRNASRSNSKVPSKAATPKAEATETNEPTHEPVTPAVPPHNDQDPNASGAPDDNADDARQHEPVEPATSAEQAAIRELLGQPSARA